MALNNETEPKMSDSRMEEASNSELEAKETKPVVENKSSIEILSELFSTFDADLPVLTDDQLTNASKKPKKKKKHKSKDKKHKKKSKKRKRSRSSSSSSSSSSELDFDLTKLLVKQEESAEKKIKIEGTDLSLDLDRIAEIQPEEEVDVKPCIDKLQKQIDNEDGEISSDSEEKHHSKHKKHKSKHKHKKEKDKDKTEKHSSNEKEKSEDYKHRNRSRSRSPHKQTDLRHKIKHKHESRRDDGGSDTRHREDRRHGHYHDDDFYKNRDRGKSFDRGGKDDFYRTRDRDKSSDRNTKDDFYKTRERDKSGNDAFYRNRSFDRYRDDRRYRSRDHSRDRYRDRRHSPKNDSYIDKKKLLEIARKNAIQMMKSGSLPGALSLGPQAQEKVIAAIRAGGKTIEELTDFCKTLATKEDLGELSEVEEEKDSGESDCDKPFNHPFQIKDRPSTITMNIKNSVPLPIKSTQERTTELRMQFPVSSGQHHRKNENEWVPVEPKKDPTPAPKPSIVLTKAVVPITPMVPPTNSAPLLSTVPAPAPVASNPAQQQIDISAIVSQRLSAMRKLQENPHDVQAISQMYRSTKEVQSWAESKQQPGQFTGMVGGNFLSHTELSSGYQAWARKDQLQSAAPVSGGMGMHLLQKMGWKPGEGLGKEKTGALEPLLLEVKLDKRGLVANEESQRKKKGKLAQKQVRNPTNKHPVSLLGEYACKNKLGAPSYELCFECGPDHKKNFLFKVSLNGMEFQPNVASPNKKEAKANAALLCLQKLGVVPE